MVKINTLKTWQKISIGIIVAVIILAALVFPARMAMQNVFYPMARPMPPVVSDSMPTILVRLETVLKTNALQVLDGLQPGLSPQDIQKLEQQYHATIPDDLQMIYEWHDGARHTVTYVGDDFIPLYRFVPLEEALTETASAMANATPAQRVFYNLLLGYRNSWIYLFDDGSGNGYWFDPKRKPSQGAVFYNFTEDGEYTFFPSPKNLMAGIADCYAQGIFRVKPGTSPPQLDEDLDRSPKVWAEYGESNQQ